MSNKPLILLLDKLRGRSPLLTQFYEHISRKDGPFEVVRDERLHSPLGLIVKNRLGGRIPNYIYWGFSTAGNLTKSRSFLEKHRNKFKIIFGPGDTTQLVTLTPYGKFEQFIYSNIDFLVIRVPKIEEHRTMKLVREFIANPKPIKIKNATVINAPWGVNPNKYKPRNINRDIDVSLICTVSSRTDFHLDRRKAFNIIRDLSKQIKVVASTYCGPKLDTNKDIWGEEYLDILHRSKLFIVDASRRDAPVQKYFEGPACGTAIIGNIPTPIRDVLVHDVSAIIVDDFDKIGNVILDYLKRPDDIKRIAQEGRKRILEKFNVNKVSEEFEETILEDYRKNTALRKGDNFCI